MNAKMLANRLNTMSTKLWAEAIRFEKLSDLADDHLTACQDIDLPYDDNYERRSHVLRDVAKRLTGLSFALAGLDTTLQDMAMEVDELVDELEEIAPSKRR